MRIALFQTKLAWENPEKNRKFIEEYVVNEAQMFDLLVLPEMFTSGFTMNPQNVAEAMNGQTIQWLQSLAKTKNCAITGSLVIEEDGSFFNRMVFVFPTGEMEYYDKRHLFRMGAENEFYQAGDKQVIVSYKGWNLAVFICYDLRFPVWSRNVGMAYDAAIYVANWPAPRANAWRTLLQARAIENLAYVVGVNRVGTDANNLSYAGDSLLVDFKGGLQLDLQAEDQILTSELSREDLAEFRAKFPAYLDADSFSLSSL